MGKIFVFLYSCILVFLYSCILVFLYSSSILQCNQIIATQFKKKVSLVHWQPSLKLKRKIIYSQNVLFSVGSILFDRHYYAEFIDIKSVLILKWNDFCVCVQDHLKLTECKRLSILIVIPFLTNRNISVQILQLPTKFMILLIHPLHGSNHLVCTYKTRATHMFPRDTWNIYRMKTAEI